MPTNWKRLYIPDEKKIEILQKITLGELFIDEVWIEGHHIRRDQLRRWKKRLENLEEIKTFRRSREQKKPVWEQLQRQIERLRERIEKLERLS